MADRREPGDDLPTSPVVPHGRVPDPAAVSPVRSSRAAPPRRGPGPPPRDWPGPVLRRLRDPLPDGYAPRFGRKKPAAAPPGEPGRTGQPARSAEPGRPGDRTGEPARPARSGGPGPAPRPDRATVRPADDRTGGGRRRDGARDGARDEVRDEDVELDPVQDLDVDPALELELLSELDPSVTPDDARALRGPEPGALRTVRRKLGKALVPGERILVAQTRHPVVLAEPVLSSVLVLLAIAAVSPYLGAADLLRNVLMAGWLFLAVRALWSWLQWSHDYFVVTDRRLMRLHGLFDVQRDMMPLTKVTDMAFERPFWGRPFRYGRFVLESAGQDQALRVISYVRDPDDVDALIGRQIFARPPFQPPGGGR